MGTLRCDHPDIEAFIDAKRDPEALHNFNLSVLVTDDFLRAVEEDREWPLAYSPAGSSFSDRCVSAGKLWRQIVESALETAEPGLLFVDTMNRENNLWYCESISATNPCGEVPLPAHGACNLGSINLRLPCRHRFPTTRRLMTRNCSACPELPCGFSTT